MNWDALHWPEIGEATLDTLTMSGVSLLFTVLLGLPLGIALFLTGPGRLLEQRAVYAVLSLAVNLLRSLPFVILLIVMLPLTVWVTGTSIGVPGAIPPLVAAAAPFFARLVENVLREVDHGVTEACLAMGARVHQVVLGGLLPEAWPGVLGAITVTAVALLSYSAMSGAIGGGGLGDLAIRYGYQRFQTEVMVVTVAVLLLLVQAVQWTGDRVVLRCTRR
ncbi:methionine ABC transporter permease [Caldimonas brevitalea]|uniref:Metal ABC transporter permease n=1 Tax=Caldimonas brevitalea TaxID=413882 RepID=A0A0G3BKL7_9BURK|nr:methionine ABC transporter permease [Caldimonas brevitalea]AKJ28533.1 metal ABC transporter permease [Caldimonas brevitalea]